MGSRNYRGGGSSSSYNMPSHSNHNPDEDHMDHTNQSMAESLSKKLGQLKSFAIDLNGEVRDHIPLIENVGDDIDSTSHRMGGSSGRLRNMNRNRGLAGRKLTCCVGISVTIFLFIVYHLLFRMNRSS